MKKIRPILYALVFISLGLALGGYLFSDVQPRSFISLNHCSNESCLKANDLAGLLTSIGIQKIDSVFLSPVYETDKIVVVNYPLPNTSFHEVIIPKKDIKDISQVTEADQDYIMAIFAYISKVVREKHLTVYKVVTNGPAYQNSTYLHFHLIGELPH
jgi:hypothetical protein